MSVGAPGDDAGALRSISAIVLAAGLSRRAAPQHKLLVTVHGRPVVRATVEAMCGAGFGETIVVIGHERTAVANVVAGLPVRLIFAADFASGMGHSLAAGVREARPDARAFAITPGDLPFLTPQLVRHVASRFALEGFSRHVIPMARGERGHPVMITGDLRGRLETLTGDAGARGLLGEPAERARCVFLEVGDRAVIRDVDTLAAVRE